MSKGKNSLKILYMIDILKDNSVQHNSIDPGRFINASRIIDKLKEISAKNGEQDELSADRKSIYTYVSPYVVIPVLFVILFCTIKTGVLLDTVLAAGALLIYGLLLNFGHFLMQILSSYL